MCEPLIILAFTEHKFKFVGQVTDGQNVCLIAKNLNKKLSQSDYYYL